MGSDLSRVEEEIQARCDPVFTLDGRVTSLRSDVALSRGKSGPVLERGAETQSFLPLLCARSRIHRICGICVWGTPCLTRSF